MKVVPPERDYIMAVYVDDMRASYGRMIMCHMIADTLVELDDMADKIGVARKWRQDKGHATHYDIALSKRVLAVKAGAIEVTRKELGIMLFVRRRFGELLPPEEAKIKFASIHLSK